MQKAMQCEKRGDCNDQSIRLRGWTGVHAEIQIAQSNTHRQCKVQISAQSITKTKRVDWSGSRGSGHAQSSQTRILRLTAIKNIIIIIILVFIIIITIVIILIILIFIVIMINHQWFITIDLKISILYSTVESLEAMHVMFSLSENWMTYWPE